jgi:hypothetical protein
MVERSCPWESKFPVELYVWYIDSGEVYSIQIIKYMHQYDFNSYFKSRLNYKVPFGKKKHYTSFTTEFKQAFTVEYRDKLWEVVKEKKKQVTDYNWKWGQSIYILGSEIS